MSKSLEEYIKELETLREKQNAVQKDFNAARTAKDEEKMKSVQTELRDLRNEISKLEAEIKEKYPDAKIPGPKGKKEKKKGQQQTAQAEKPQISENYGILPLHQSKERKNRVWENLGNLTAEKSDNKEVWFRARIHSIRGKSAKLIFLVLRQRLFTVQAVLDSSKGCERGLIAFAKQLNVETLVNVGGLCVKSPVTISGCTQQDVEIQVTKLFVESGSVPNLPLSLDDASRPYPLIEAQKKEIKAIEKEIEAVEQKLNAATDEAEKKTLQAELDALRVKRGSAAKYTWPRQPTRLDNRILDLRTQTSQAIFRIQSGVCTLFREFLLSNGFTEIHSPKILGAASEGGAEVFKVQYFDKSAFLAQSPQLYKQMAICSDFERVFEIGPVFRAESSFTHRHLTEFVGLDIEMQINEHYHEVLDILDGLFTSIFKGLETRFSNEIALVQKQFPFEPLQYKFPSPRINFKDGMNMLREEVKRLREELKKEGLTNEKIKKINKQILIALGGQEEVSDTSDLTTPQEKLLGKLVKEKYGVDFYFLDKYPADVRPFYTMIDPNDSRYTNSYDLFIRNEEICSGSQRIHDPEFLAERAKVKGIPIHTIQDYINAFKYGAPPHGGGGVGLERVVMLYLGIKNIRRSSLFPRDPSRLNP